MSEAANAYILAEAGFCLRALGRLAEAVQPVQTALEIRLAHEQWTSAATVANNLSELFLTLGDLTQALAYARQSVGLADRSGDAFERMSDRTTFADALHQAGSLAEAEAAFHESEEMQKEIRPQFPLLYSVGSSRYCDVLLSQGKYQEVQWRASQTIEVARGNKWLLDIALDNLSLGRAHSLQSLREANHPFTESADYLSRAVAPGQR